MRYFLPLPIPSGRAIRENTRESYPAWAAAAVIFGSKWRENFAAIWPSKPRRILLCCSTYTLYCVIVES